MFCTKCGASLEDGAKFCTSCGAPTRFAQVPAPEAAAPAAPAESTVRAPAAEWTAPAAPAADWSTPAAPAEPAAPAQPQANVWSAPAKPAQPQQWQQPAQPAQNAWPTPAQPTQPTQPQWQQPTQQPQQPQQPQWPQQPQQQAPQWTQQQAQQWQRQQQQAWPQTQQPAQQWSQPAQPQQTRQQPASGGTHAKAKKGGAGVIIGIIAVVLALVIGVGGFVWPGFFKKDKGSSDSGGLLGGGSSAAQSSGISASFAKKATPEELFEAVESNKADSLAHHAASIYDNFFLSNAASDDISVAGSLTVEPGDKLRELLLDAIGSDLDEINPGDDLKWLKSIAASYDVSRKDDLMGLGFAVLLNGKDFIHLNGTLQEGGELSLAVPELSDKYFSVPLDDLNLGSLGLGSNVMLSSLLSSLDVADAENLDLDAITKALPDAKTVENLLSKYLNEAIDLVETVERSDGKLSVGEVSAEYTVLTSTIDKATRQAIVDKIGPELKEDKDLKKIIVDLANAAGQDGNAKYAEFVDQLDSKLQEAVDNADKDLHTTVYLDKKTSEVRGRIVASGDDKLEILMPEDGGKFGLLIRYADKAGERLSLMGDGKRSGDKLTGDLDLQVDGEYYGVVGLDGFDVEKAKDGSFVGGLDLKPSASFWKLITDKADAQDKTIPESIRSILDTLVFHLDLNTSKDKATVSLTVTNGSDKFFTVSVDGAKGAAKKISPVAGIEASTWAQDITLDKLEKVVAAIEKAGVPSVYTDMLDDALDSMF